MNNKGQSLLTSSVLMLVARLSIKSIGLVSSIILARLLVPEDFGLVAIAMALFAFVELFGAFGFNTALIQRQDVSNADYNTAWTFKFLFGFASCVALAISAPYVAEFYADQRLTEIIYVVGVLAILNGLQNIGVVDFQRDMAFDKEFKFLLLPKIISFFITVSLALYFRNYWALVLGMLAGSAVQLVTSFLMHSFRPRLSLASFEALFAFSKWLLLNNVVNFLNLRLVELVLGRMLSPAATGTFALANEIASLPTTEMAAPINKASFPMYSKVAKLKAELAKVYISTLALIGALTVPAALGIALVSDLFVLLVLGEQWKEAIPVMQLIAISSILFSLSTNNGYIYLACGKPKLTFYISCLRIVIFLPLLFYFLDAEGLKGAGLAYLWTSVVLFVLTQLAITRYLNMDYAPLLSVFFRPMLAGGIMYVFGNWLKTGYLNQLSFLDFGLLVLSCVAVYVAVTLLLWFMAGRPEGIELTIYEKVRRFGVAG